MGGESTSQLLREAQTNGAIFLALAPNGPARNSINEEGSLLRTLCGSDEATNCRGDTAAEAEFDFSFCGVGDPRGIVRTVDRALHELGGGADARASAGV